MLVLRRRVTPFVVLFPGRVGSTYLISALQQHPDVHADGERLDGMREKGAGRQLEWADSYLRGPMVGSHKAIGFKTKLRDVLDPTGFANLLERRLAHLVVLGRRNDVKHAVSRITAKELHATTNRWNRFDAREGVAPVTIDVERFDALLERIARDKQQIVDYAAGLPVPQLHLDYEELLVDHDAAFGRVLDHIGVARRPLEGATLKNTSDDLRDAIVNFDELRARYDGTPYAAMFDEVVVG
jgi:LPS sulfotransferase NodH